MTARTPTLLQLLEATLDNRFDDVHTSMPGSIESFDEAKQTANIKLLLKRRFEDETGEMVDESMGVAVNVPIVWPGAGGFRMVFPIKPGDGVLVIFAEASIDRWQELGGEQPVDARRFHLADAIAVPGLRHNTWAGFASDALSIGSDTGPGIILKASEVQLGARVDSPATHPVLFGDTAVTDLDGLLTSLISQLGQLSGFVAAAAAGLTTAAALNAIPIVGGILALPGFTIVVTQLGTIVSTLAQMITAVTTLKAQLNLWKSTTVKTG